jgi:hypothetical protein
MRAKSCLPGSQIVGFSQHNACQTYSQRLSNILKVKHTCGGTHRDNTDAVGLEYRTTSADIACIAISMDSTVRGTRLDRYLEKNLDIWHNSDESGRYPSKGQAANGALDDGADRPAPFAALPAWPAGMHCSRARAVPCRYEARSSSQRVALSRGTRRASVLPEAARTAGRRPASTTSNPRGRESPTCRLWRALLCSASSRAVCQDSLPFPAPPSCWTLKRIP